ncbi:DR2241 family protein [Haloprofundus salilacus]|uniref:DR2241 family protein n=1 Tax=Haloprofundus salilacus TaxID=2876190 RepID=UPI001CCD1013|nr:DR2241 family protein [Haloprofundus salilacus]
MHAGQLDALVDAADGGDGVDFDGLRAGRDGDAFQFRTPHTERADLSEAEFREVAESNPWYVSNWFYWTREVGPEAGAADDEDRHTAIRDGSNARRAFLRWAERADDHGVPERYEALADGVTREWGQLCVTATVGDHGERRYHLRHVADADADADLSSLDVYAAPHEARSIVTYDEKGRYRPLKTAPTLRDGWAFPDLDGRSLVETVDVVYPATIPNWYREREGCLDVTHWDETAERQTGIYDIVDELDEEAVEWIAESCCVDSQCLKRRMWDADEETELDTDRGDGVFPCREPCSLVVAAARKWTTLEREESRTYEFELTPSEKEQVEEIIDAVAEGRTDEIREADVYEGANRYRARFLRAKQFDDEGNLSGTPTGDE